MDAISVLKKKILQNVAGSLKIKIPTNTVPTAPMPVQTAYAVPMGKTCVTLYSKTILIERHAKKPSSHKFEIVPEVSLAFPRQVAKPTSKSPAMMSKIQFIKVSRLILMAHSTTKHFENRRVFSNFQG